MKLHVSDALRNPGQEYEFRGEQTIAPVEMTGDTVTFEDAVVSGVYFTSGDGSVTVDGQLQVVCHAQCANCLEPATTLVTSTFRETFQRGGDPDDDEVFSYEGYTVDLEKLVMSYAVLSLPIRFLCKEDCQGLSGQYGLSTSEEEERQCQRDQHPFAALQQLFKQDEPSED